MSSISSSDSRVRDTGAQNDDVCNRCCLSAVRCEDGALRRDVVCVCYGEDTLLKAPQPEACGRFVRWRAADRCHCDSKDGCGDAQLSHQTGPATLLCDVREPRRIVAELLRTVCSAQCGGCTKCVWLPCRLYDVQPRPKQSDFCLHAVYPPSAAIEQCVCLNDVVTYRVSLNGDDKKGAKTKITDLVRDYNWEPADLVLVGQGTNEAAFATPRACALHVSVEMTLRGSKCDTAIVADNCKCPLRIEAPTPAPRITLCDNVDGNTLLNAAAAPLAWSDGTKRKCTLRWVATANGSVFEDRLLDSASVFTFDVSGQAPPIEVRAQTVACEPNATLERCNTQPHSNVLPV